MKSLTVDLYRIVYRISHVKPLALAFSLVYMTTLNMIVIYGLGQLLEGWLDFLSIVHLLFRFPYIIFTAIALLGLTFKLMPSAHNLSKAAKRNGSPILLILYTVFSLILFAYIKMGDKLL